uniref:Uncharacterized protein n=1 Tax=Hyaloperonospora arabidopsidis (strain Emoy2) TaxID=559515 RepID=M4BLK5_HYAAE
MDYRMQGCSAKTTVTHSDHGSVTVDARAALDGPTRNELLEETSVNGRSDTTWLKNASVETMSWLFNRKGRRYQLNGASFARASPGTLVPLSRTVRRPDKWMLNTRGNMRLGFGSLPWAGHHRWRPCRKAIKTFIFRSRHREGDLQRDKRMSAKDHWVVSRGADLIEWAELRRFIAISTQAHTPRPAMCSGTVLQRNLSAGSLGGCKKVLTTNESTEVAQTSIFAAANELWRFGVASTTQSIWVERLCQMQDPTLLLEEHQALAVSSLRSSLARFRRSTNPPQCGRC